MEVDSSMAKRCLALAATGSANMFRELQATRIQTSNTELSPQTALTLIEVLVARGRFDSR